MECPKGFETCLKTCYTPVCRETCEYVSTCCARYCIFEPNSVVTRIQQGDRGAYEGATRIIFEGSDEEFSELLRS